LTDFYNIYPQKKSYTERETASIIEIRKKILTELNDRKKLIENLDKVNFDIKKNVETGLASYILAIECYKYFQDRFIPNTKISICSLRAAWLAHDLTNQTLKKQYYKIAHIFYSKILEKPENFESFNLGPDWGHNFGFDGVRYLKALLDFRHIDQVETNEKKYSVVKSIRATFSKIRGFGKASQAKPGPLLKLSEDMFEKIQPYYEKLKSLEDNNELSSAEEISKSEVIKDKPKVVKQSISPKPEEKQEISSTLDNYHKASVEIIKLSLQKGLKKDSVTEIKNILKKYF
jgi:uncharacterized protein (DUF2225 family)